MHLSFPKCLMMAEASKMCPAPAPVSHGGVWLAWFLPDDTLGYSLRGGWWSPEAPNHAQASSG